jgi:hypothetical protein
MRRGRFAVPSTARSGGTDRREAWHRALPAEAPEETIRLFAGQPGSRLSARGARTRAAASGGRFQEGPRERQEQAVSSKRRRCSIRGVHRNSRRKRCSKFPIREDRNGSGGGSIGSQGPSDIDAGSGSDIGQDGIDRRTAGPASVRLRDGDMDRFGGTSTRPDGGQDGSAEPVARAMAKAGIALAIAQDRVSRYRPEDRGRSLCPARDGATGPETDRDA